jgi:hypothetical protein
MPSEGCRAMEEGGWTTEIMEGLEKIIYIAVITIIIPLKLYYVFSVYFVAKHKL